MPSTSRVLISPPHSEELEVAFPVDHVMLLTFNRPKYLNAMTPRMTHDLGKILDWFEEEQHLWCARSPSLTVQTENEEKRHLHTGLS
jgi:hypothetical protein